jgi:hypothetical protein
LGRSLILRLDPPTSVTGDTHLCIGRLALLSPTKSTPRSPSPNVPVPTPWQDEPQGTDQPMTTATGAQSNLFAWAKDLEQENKRIAEINAERVRAASEQTSLSSP